MEKTILVTGGAGFIGSHLIKRLLRQGHRVVCLDNFDESYAPLKCRNISSFQTQDNFALAVGDIRDQSWLHQLFSQYPFTAIVHLAALAGVRPSLERPGLYQEVNVQGTINLLEESRQAPVEKFVFASSSSIYGASTRVPFREDQELSPVSPYGASKAAAELFCYTYHHLYGLPIVALRFFTVYGPRQRPDMAIQKFARTIEEGGEVSLYGDGTSKRDYTYVSDIIEGIERAMSYRAKGFDIFNLGSSQPVELQQLIELLEDALGKKARVKRLPPHPGDVPITLADISKAGALLGYQPQVGIEEGISFFIRWFKLSQSTEAHPLLAQVEQVEVP